MHPLESAVRVKGSNRFSRSELVGILAFKLRIMSVGDAKASIEAWIREGILHEEGDHLVVDLESLKSEKQKDIFEEMLNYVMNETGMDREGLLKALSEFSKRYGPLDMKLVLYLFGLEKGLNMERFRDRLKL